MHRREIDGPAKHQTRPDSSGHPLDDVTRAFMESRFGCDFTHIRLHTNREASESAKEAEARAFTIGEDIWFGDQQYAPRTKRGRALLAHELTHIVQQRPTGCSAIGAGLRAGTTAEGEAAEAAEIIGAGGPASVRGAVTSGSVQLSPLRDDLGLAMARGGKGGVFDILRARGPIAADPDLAVWLDTIFGPNTDPLTTTDDRWLADQLVQYGAEPRWPRAALLERERRAHGHQWAPELGNIEATFEVGQRRPPIPAYYFPGTSNARALIIGGVHGDEAAAVEVVNILLERMRAPSATMPYYSVIIVPALFSENVRRARRETPGRADPNRQMPPVGATSGAMDARGRPTDEQGRPIEPENLILLDLVERFQPERVASVHGHSPPRPGKPDMPGITSDPRPGSEAMDEALALEMARRASSMPGGARVPGNRLGTPQETARYPTQEAVHQEGVTFGQYGSRASARRPAMNMILIETFGNAPSARDRRARRVELESLATVLRDIFLGPPRHAPR